MSLISIVLVIAVVGLCVYLIGLLPIPDIFRKVIYAVTALFLVLWVLQSLGLVSGLPVVRLR